eukprot:5091804-Pleurochrysis_carterae.AAC.1
MANLPCLHCISQNIRLKEKVERLQQILSAPIENVAVPGGQPTPRQGAAATPNLRQPSTDRKLLHPPPKPGTRVRGASGSFRKKTPLPAARQLERDRSTDEGGSNTVVLYAPRMEALAMALCKELNITQPPTCTTRVYGEQGAKNVAVAWERSRSKDPEIKLHIEAIKVRLSNALCDGRLSASGANSGSACFSSPFRSAST